MISLEVVLGFARLSLAVGLKSGALAVDRPDLIDGDGDLWRARPDGAYVRILSPDELSARYGPVCEAPPLSD